MKSSLPSFGRNALKLALVASTYFAIANTLHAQIYVTDLDYNTISEYGLDGTPNGSNPLINNLSNPFGIALSGEDAYVANYGVGTIAEYNVLTGTQVGSGPLVTGLENPADIALYDGNLYVANMGAGTINEYSASNGAPVNGGTLITGLSNAEYLTISGNDLYVSTFNAIYAYDATTGTPLNGGNALVSGLSNARGIAVNGNDLYVTDATDGTITVYDATDGAQVGTGPLVTGLNDPRKVVFFDGDLYVSDVGSGDNSIMAFDATNGNEVVGCFPVSNAFDFTIAGDPAPVPEPSTWALLVAGVVFLVYRTRAAAVAQRLPTLS